MKDTKGVRQVLELLAENEHKTWASWMEWLFNSECGTLNADGSFTIKPEKVDRWKYQLKVPYKLLSEEEKESDRLQVYELLPALQEIMLGMPDTTNVTRVEVIDQDGRSYVNWNDTNQVLLELQDDNRTLKVFIGRVEQNIRGGFNNG